MEGSFNICQGKRTSEVEKKDSVEVPQAPVLGDTLPANVETKQLLEYIRARTKMTSRWPHYRETQSEELRTIESHICSSTQVRNYEYDVVDN